MLIEIKFCFEASKRGKDFFRCFKMPMPSPHCFLYITHYLS